MSEALTQESAYASRRPPERVALYNPSFVALIVAQAAVGHESQSGSGMPFALAFLAVPIVLDQPTRQQLPKQARHKMAAWLQAHPVLRAGLARRAESLVTEVRAGVRHGLRAERLTIHDSLLTASKPAIKRKGVSLSSEVDEILRRAEFVGGWFGLSGAPAGIYALWRVQP